MRKRKNRKKEKRFNELDEGEKKLPEKKKEVAKERGGRGRGRGRERGD